MPDWSSVVTFGRPDPILPLRVRPSAYALVRNSVSQIVLVQTPGGFYLPGGGCDPGETVARTVQREISEEISLEVAVGTWRRMAIEHVAAASEGASFEKRSTFCDAVLIRDTGLPSEPNNTALWVSPADAVARLVPESHRWAVVEWLADPASKQSPSRPAV